MVNIRGQEVYMDDFFRSNLEGLKEFVDAKFDGIFVIDGMEGSGKSELGKQSALFLNPNFSEKDVVYDTEQFFEWIKTAKRGDVCLWDEFVFAGLSTDTFEEMQKALIKTFTVMRERGLYVILVIPYMFMMKKYFIIARTRFLLHVYTNGIQRGFFKFHDYTQKLLLFNYGHKTWLYSPSVKPNFYARFGGWSGQFLDEIKIKQKKDEALKRITTKDNAIKLTPRQIQTIASIKKNPFTVGENGLRQSFLMLQATCKQFLGVNEPEVVVNDEQNVYLNKNNNENIL